MRQAISHVLPISKSVSGEDFAKEIPELLSKSRNRVVCSTSLHSEFYNRPEIRESITNAVNRGINFKILAGPPCDNLNEISWLKELKNSKSNLQIRKINRGIRHVMYVDNRHVRIEEEHPAHEEGTNNKIIYNTVIARSGTHNFDLVWADCEEINDNEGSE